MNCAQNSGTTVIATKYDANSANTTANARALNRNWLTPASMVTGKNTTAVVRVAASTGRATSRPPRSAAAAGDSPSSRWRKMFSSTTTELSIRREKTRARPPRIMVLTVPPPSDRAMKVASAESGIERKTAAVARILPRKTRIMIPVRTSPMAPSWMRFSIALRTNTDWSKTTLATSSFGTSTRPATAARMPSTTAMVLASPPCLSTGR